MHSGRPNGTRRDKHFGDVYKQYSLVLSLSKVQSLPVGLRWKQVVTRRDQCGLPAGVCCCLSMVLVAHDGDLFPQRVQGE